MNNNTISGVTEPETEPPNTDLVSNLKDRSINFSNPSNVRESIQTNNI